MQAPKRRDNDYWAGRLKKDGHDEILAQYERGEITMYAASQEAGYRSKQPKSPAGKLQFHWKRANYDDRMKFVSAHALEINRVLKDVAAIAQAKKTSQ